MLHTLKRDASSDPDEQILSRILCETRFIVTGNDCYHDSLRNNFDLLKICIHDSWGGNLSEFAKRGSCFNEKIVNTGPD